MDSFSFIANADPVAIEGQYLAWRAQPEAVDPSWASFFKGFDFAVTHGNGVVAEGAAPDRDHLVKELHVVHLIHAYRTRGHLLSKTNPIRPRKDRDPGVALNYHQLSDGDLNTRFGAGILIGLENATLKEIIAKLESTYARAIGIEYMHIRDTHIREWCRDYFESTAHNYIIPLEKKKRILSKLNEAVVFENFLHKKYVGQKRFSLEGGENTIPALDALINKAASMGVEMAAIGMAHRGRLNVLANTLGKTYEYIFNEFEGNTQADTTFGDGDVKYHLGFSSSVKTAEGKDVRLELVPNPSHLEAVNPVIEGYVRGEAELMYDGDLSRVLPILIHGDAALAGQGIVYEVAQMSQLRGYQTGGTVHFVINNQIGFTTDFDDARSSDYCTAVAKVVDSPVIHVNGDDAEAVVYAMEFAASYRQKFNKDVYVDMLCYRRHGHNESDEPKFTQPAMYALIEKHPNPREVYNKVLIERGEIDADLAKTYEKNFQGLLQDRLNMVKQKQLPELKTFIDQEWAQMRKSTPDDFLNSPATAISEEQLKNISNALTSYPSSIIPIKKVQKLIEERRQMLADGKVNWALGELLAYGSILLDGNPVRLSGQDVERGTFSHRHALIRDEETSARFNPLSQIAQGKARFNVYNSLLSEYAVLGFEYGYSLASPHGLTIWEAQFGDFANGAQTVIDQFLSSGESKWQKMSGLVMLLPHGYEGQGPEHSNARPERFLQLSAEYNMVVANVTTPANFFHLIRRQLTWPFRKPLIVMSPKALLRHPLCVSTVKELEGGSFQELIVDDCVDKKVKRVLFCSGKIYYDLLNRKLAEQREDIAIVRLEQLYPMPEQKIEAVYARFPKAEYYWVQEEPKNMGYWTYILRYEPNQKMKLLSRKASASPATGYAKVHEREQQEILDKAFQI